MLSIINCQNVVIKYNTRVWRDYLQQKYQNKNTLQDFGENTYSRNSKYIYIFFVFPIYKGLDIKMSLISAEGYKNAGVFYLTIRKTGELWVSIKDVGDGLGVKNISDLVLKEIQGICEKKINKRRN